MQPQFPNKKIGDFSTLTALTGNELLLVQDTDGSYKNILVSLLTSAIASSGSGGSGGSGNNANFPVSATLIVAASSLQQTTNGNVTNLADDSGNGNFAAGLGNPPPLFEANHNGKKVFYFDGNGYFDFKADALIPVSEEFMVFCVAQFNADTCLLGGGGDNWGFQITGSNAYAVCNGSLVQCSYPSLVGNTTNIVCWGIFRGIWQCYINGISYTAGNNISNMRGANGNYLSRTILGAKWDGSISNIFQGYAYDVCVKETPTLSNINAIGNYYATKHLLTWNTIS